MEDNFKIEIISPEKIIFSDSAKIAKIPSYEGDLSILKKHISIIAFLRPGIIKVEITSGKFEEFFVEDGTAEFFQDTLIILSASAINIKDLTKEFLDNINKDTQEKLALQNISDKDRYILNHKLDIIKEIRV